MQIKYQIIDSDLIFWFNGELDEYAAGLVRDKIDAVIVSTHFQKVIFDLSQLAFADSTGIGLFIGRFKLLSRNKTPLYIRNPQPQMDKIMKTTGLYEIMPKI
ncbi:MAG: STAS domain-containing protein [Bacillota bacterium]